VSISDRLAEEINRGFAEALHEMVTADAKRQWERYGFKHTHYIFRYTGNDFGDGPSLGKLIVLGSPTEAEVRSFGWIKLGEQE